MKINTETLIKLRKKTLQDKKSLIVLFCFTFLFTILTIMFNLLNNRVGQVVIIPCEICASKHNLLCLYRYPQLSKNYAFEKTELIVRYSSEIDEFVVFNDMNKNSPPPWSEEWWCEDCVVLFFRRNMPLWEIIYKMRFP